MTLTTNVVRIFREYLSGIFKFCTRPGLLILWFAFFSDGRKKILIQRIDDMKTRTVTFNKRRVGVFFVLVLSDLVANSNHDLLFRFDEEGHGTQHSLRLSSRCCHFQWYLLNFESSLSDFSVNAERFVFVLFSGENLHQYASQPMDSMWNRWSNFNGPYEDLCNDDVHNCCIV
jgi:hypothetical protein